MEQPPQGATPAARLDFLPTSGVNEFGLPSSVMRCFEITEDLMDFSIEKNLSPRESLQQYTRRPMPPNNLNGPPHPGMMSGNGPHFNGMEDHYSYSSAPQTPATPLVRDPGPAFDGEASDDYDPGREKGKKRGRRSSSKTQAGPPQPLQGAPNPKRHKGNNSNAPTPNNLSNPPTPVPAYPNAPNNAMGNMGNMGGGYDMGGMSMSELDDYLQDSIV